MAISVSTKRRSSLPNRIALIGDSTLEMAGAGATNVPAKLVTLGWNAGKISFYAVISKAIAYTDTNGFTTLQNMAQARTALGAEPDTWYFNLGSNGHKDNLGGGVAATQATWMNAVLDDIAAHGSAKAIWSSISQQDGYDDTAGGNGNEATRLAWNAIAKPLVTARSFGAWADWHGYIKAWPGENALWSGGVHMTTAGYLVKRDFIALQVGPGGG